MIEEYTLSINGEVVRLAKNNPCKLSDVIYIQLRERCTSKKIHLLTRQHRNFLIYCLIYNRNSVHISKFNAEHFEESALSYHLY